MLPCWPSHKTSALLHELRIHEVQLEMQNDELRKAQTELALSRDRFIELYDFATVGYATLDLKGVIVEANLTAAKMLCVVRQKLLGQQLHRFVASDSQDVFYLRQQLVFGNQPRHACDLALKTTNGSKLPIRLESTLFDNPDSRRSNEPIADAREIYARRTASAPARFSSRSPGASPAWDFWL